LNQIKKDLPCEDPFAAYLTNACVSSALGGMNYRFIYWSMWQ